MENIFLIGFMGAGKSAVSAALQQKTGMALVEMDARIEEEQGMPITKIFETKGEPAFRDMESALLRTLGEEGNTIVSCGGGVVVRPENTACMKSFGKIVFLTAEPETIYERVKNSTNRPILNGNMNVEYIRGLMEKRRTLYNEAADVKIATDGKTVNEIADEILNIMNK